MSMAMTTASTMTANTVQGTGSKDGWRRDGLIGLWGRMIHRDPEVYAAWLEDRDLTTITAALLRLNERQLNRLGMSRATLALDVEALAVRADREGAIVSDILRIVGEADNADRMPSAAHAIAAE